MSFILDPQPPPPQRAGMPATHPVVLGLVLALPAAGPRRDALLAALAGRPELRLGSPQAHLLPLTAEVGNPMELHRWLESLPDVGAVDVAFVEVAAAESTPLPA
jgi:hypothetical protein